MDFIGVLYVWNVGIEIKVYICLFICVIIRVIYFEVVEDLIVEVFLFVFCRFVSCKFFLRKLIFDNVLIFLLVNNELKELFEFYVFKEIFVREGVEW